MSRDADTPIDRRTELLTDRALGGLAGDEAAELDQLLEGGRDDAFELAAAAVDLGCIDEADEALPPALRARIEASAGLDPRSGPVIKAPATVSSFPEGRREARRDVIQYAGWGAAAACLLIAAWSASRPVEPARAVIPPPETSSSAPVAPRRSAAEERQALLATATDTVRIPWTATRDPAAAGASGDVVWSNAAQRGYMRFHGLAANDPRLTQFQLWIFDRRRDDRYPVDGGVFDIDAPTGDVIIPITARLRVEEPALFAVTIEPPGGVVVSKREHIVLTATPKTTG